MPLGGTLLRHHHDAAGTAGGVFTDWQTANLAYYARNRSTEIARVRARQSTNLALFRNLRRAPCADCGQIVEPFQMDFDHRDPADKSFV